MTVDLVSTPTATDHFVAYCKPCLRPVRITDATRTTDFLRVTCPDCGVRLRAERLYGVKTADTCDPRCMGAVGKSCSCACGGANHGRAFSVVETTMLAGALKRHRDGVQKRRQAAEKRAETRKQAREAEARAALDAWKDANRDVVDYLGDGARFAYGEPEASDFLYEMAGIITRYAQNRPLTDGQARGVRRCMEARARWVARRAAEAAEAKPVPTGKAVEITGEVIFTDLDEGVFNGRPVSRYVMTVKGDGWKVRATIPAALQHGDTVPGSFFGLKGRRVRFVADVEQSRKSDSYGFAKRPRKAELA